MSHNHVASQTINITYSLNIIISLAVSFSILWQYYFLYKNILSTYCKRKNKYLLLVYLIQVLMLLIYPFCVFVPWAVSYYNLYYSTMIYNNIIFSAIIRYINYMSQILFKNTTIYLLLQYNNSRNINSDYNYQRPADYNNRYYISPVYYTRNINNRRNSWVKENLSSILIFLSTLFSLLILSISYYYKVLSNLLFICLSTSEYILLFLVCYKLNCVKEVYLLLGVKIFEVVNIFSKTSHNYHTSKYVSGSGYGIIELLSYLIQYEVFKSKLLKGTLKENYRKNKSKTVTKSKYGLEELSELSYESEGLSVLDEVYY
ncbi:hypothetical protein CDIK_1500 [Cucumispora dikerogammari]|nr:hypothetical protein CDIK_1500 [Cucumispora dikerogammari]